MKNLKKIIISMEKDVFTQALEGIVIEHQPRYIYGPIDLVIKLARRYKLRHRITYKSKRQRQEKRLLGNWEMKGFKKR